MYVFTKVCVLSCCIYCRLYSSYLYNHAKYEAVSSSTFDQYAREAVKLYSDCFVRYSVRQCANNATIFQQAKVQSIYSQLTSPHLLTNR